MPATVLAVLIGRNKSAVRAQIACTAGATSLDVLTVNHQLGGCPNQIVAILRSTVVSASLTGVGLNLRSWDATAALFDLTIAPGGGPVSGRYDIVFEKTHSLVK